MNQLQALEAEQEPDNIPPVFRGKGHNHSTSYGGGGSFDHNDHHQGGRGGNGNNRSSGRTSRGPSSSSSGPYPSTPQQPTTSSYTPSSHSSSFSSTPGSTPGGSINSSGGNGVGDRVARIRLRMQELLAEVGRQGALLHQRDLRIADLEADASRHAAAYAQALAPLPPSSTSSSSSSSGGGNSNNGSSSGGSGAHELTHLKCAVLEYVLADPEDCAKKQQLTAVMARLLHFTKRETEAALAVANPEVAEYDPLSFLGGFLASS